MGRSTLYKIDVLRLIATRIEPTLALVIVGTLMALLIAVPFAALSARRQGTAADHAVRIVSTAGIGFPSFWLGAMLIILFAVKLGWLPVSGYGENLRRQARFTWSCPASPSPCRSRPCITRSLRAGMIAGLQSDVATAARARGMPESTCSGGTWCPTRSCPPSTCWPSTSAG